MDTRTIDIFNCTLDPEEWIHGNESYPDWKTRQITDLYLGLNKNPKATAPDFERTKLKTGFERIDVIILLTMTLPPATIRILLRECFENQADITMLAAQDQTTLTNLVAKIGNCRNGIRWSYNDLRWGVYHYLTSIPFVTESRPQSKNIYNANILDNEELEEEVRDLQKEVESKTSYIKQLEVTVKDLQRNVPSVTLVRENERLVYQVQQLTQEVDKFANHILNSTQDTYLKNSYKTMEQQVQNQERELFKLRAENNQLRSTSDTLGEQVSELQATGTGIDIPDIDRTEIDIPPDIDRTGVDDIVLPHDDKHYTLPNKNGRKTYCNPVRTKPCGKSCFAKDRPCGVYRPVNDPTGAPIYVPDPAGPIINVPDSDLFTELPYRYSQADKYGKRKKCYTERSFPCGKSCLQKGRTCYIGK